MEEKNAALYKKDAVLQERTACHHRCAIQTPSPLPKKENHEHGWKTKSEENSPTPVEPEVRRAGLERGGGRVVESVYCEGLSIPEIHRKSMEWVWGGRKEEERREEEGKETREERKGMRKGGDGRPVARAAHHMPQAHELQDRTT
jgi:hypothetical protein